MTDDMRAKAASLTQQKAAAKAELAKLTKQRAEARISGATFEGAARVDELERELQELEEAQTMAAQLADDAELRARKEARAGIIDSSIAAFEATRDEYLAQVERLQKGAEEMAGAMFAINKAAGKIVSTANSITGHTAVEGFSHSDLQDRLMLRIGDQLGGYFDRLRQFMPAGADAERWNPDWAADEKKLFQNQFGKSMMTQRARAQELRSPAAE